MTENEFLQYWVGARNAVREDHDATFGSRALAQKLGLEYPEVGYWSHIKLTLELKNALLMMQGPYADTVALIYRLRHDQR